MSDLVDGRDDSHMRVSNLYALYVAEDSDVISVYLTDVLDYFSGPLPYRLELTFGGNTKLLEDEDNLPWAIFESTVSVTTGGTFTARLSLYPS